MSTAIVWTSRREPLAPAGVVAADEAARRLGLALLARTDDALARLRGVAGHAFLALLGEPHDLPWADGVTYVGRDPAAPGLLVPTLLDTRPSIALVARAVFARPDATAPAILLARPARIVSIAVARPVARSYVERWLGGDA